VRDPMRRIGWLLVVGYLALPVRTSGQEAPTAPATPEQGQPSVAQEPAPAAVPEADPGSSQQPVVLDPTARAKTEVTLDRRTRVGAGIGFSGPLGAAASVRMLHGLGADVRDGSTRVKAVCAIPMPHCAQGFLLQADAGSGGGKLSLGLGAWAKIDEESFRGTAGVALRLGFARTWGNPIGTEPGLSYLGPELDLSVIRVNLTLGVLFRVAGDRGSSALFSWGLGFGL
jgi:hypothetical protein